MTTCPDPAKPSAAARPTGADSPCSSCTPSTRSTSPRPISYSVRRAGGQTVVRAERPGRKGGLPVIYADDNFGQWRTDLSAVVERCPEPGCKGRELADLPYPDGKDYFVLKSKHSAFFSTTLDTLPRYLGTRTLEIGGFVADVCVVFTADDADVQDFRVVVPADGVASDEAADQDSALALIRRVLEAETRGAAEIDFAALCGG